MSRRDLAIGRYPRQRGVGSGAGIHEVSFTIGFLTVIVVDAWFEFPAFPSRRARRALDGGGVPEALFPPSSTARGRPVSEFEVGAGRPMGEEPFWRLTLSMKWTLETSHIALQFVPSI
ncbi:hypothetical protein AYO47_05695 [Planctomyces sp. SCGC AG-212-M04]|nr:hypothetical protein AYO47_05695 [Planctomyces sp. SCGC AG-212-M04]